MNISKLRFVKQLFINGRFVDSAKKETFDVINPNDETVLATMQRGGTADIDAAVDAARNAFEKGPWRTMDAYDRGACLLRLADLVDKHADELAAIEAINNGKPASIARVADLFLTPRCYRYYGGWADKIKGHTSPI